VSGRSVELFYGVREVKKRAVFDLNKLEQFPPAQANVTYSAAGSVVTESFTGVLLWDLLNDSPVNGIVTDPNVKNDILHKVIIVTGTDCYQSVFGTGEINPFFGGSQIIFAYATGGESLGSAGFARIVVPDDKSGRPVCLEHRQASRYETPPLTIREGNGLWRVARQSCPLTLDDGADHRGSDPAQPASPHLLVNCQRQA
jgi:hypothetical protein